jgi:hypothetical protein
MTKGILLFAHNNRNVDYILMSLISGGLAKKHLNVPVSLVTDESTIAWAKESNIYDKLVSTFDKIIEVEKPVTNNTRRLHDGDTNIIVPFVNSNRSNVWDLTPYDRTLMIDTDYFIFSDRLNEYWDVDEDIMISSALLDIYDQQRTGYHDRYVSDTGVHMYWATNVMFTKNERSKTFFDLVSFIRDHYDFYADLFRFSNIQYRNDISFSVAKHILDGFNTDTSMSLPPVLTAIDKDILETVSDTGKLTFLIDTRLNAEYSAAALTNIDIHIMNKQSVIRNAEALLRLI